MGAVTTNIFEHKKLKIYKLKKIEAEIFQAVPKERGPIEVGIKVSLSGKDVDEKNVRRMLSRVEVEVAGMPAPSAEKSEPIFRIYVVAEGIYEVNAEIPLENLQDDAFSEDCASPLYTLAVGEINSLAAKLDLPRIRVPLILNSKDMPPGEADLNEARPPRKTARKTTSRKK